MFGFSILAGWKGDPVSYKDLKFLADFEWASAARYIVYITRAAGLSEINSNHVISFPLARIGPDRLLKQKKRVLSVLKGNKAGIERFVGAYRAELNASELTILRSLYLQYKDNEETVRGHISVIEECMVEIEIGILKSKEEGEDDTLF